MNAHSEWIKWRAKFGIGLPDEFTGQHSAYHPIGAEEAFKAGYNASFKELAPRRELAAKAAELESDLEDIRDIVERR